jgi:sortase (surface protein transpeptidase)
VPAAGVNAPMVRTSRPRIPLTRESLRRSYFWRGDGVPGEKGSVLISLHSNRHGWAAGNRLPRLKRGATVRLVTPDGVARFRIVRSDPRAPLNLSEKEMAELQSNIGPSRIVLTTCNKFALGRNGQYKFRSLAVAKRVK